MRKPSDPEPPTIADLEEHGAQACLAALREEFTEHHKHYPQFRGWTEGTVLGIATRMIGGHGTFVRAEAGDLLLVKRDRSPLLLAGFTPQDLAYAPRIGWNISIWMCGVEDVPAVTRAQAEQVLAAVKDKFSAWCLDTARDADGKLDFDAPPVPLPDQFQPHLTGNWKWRDGVPPVPFAIIWEHGPDDWAMHPLDSAEVDVESTVELQGFAPGKVLRHKVVKVPGGVRLEPVYSYVLGIYPAE